MRPEPFFSADGIDRADVLRADPDRVAELARSEGARQLVWRDGLPAVGPDGRLEWQPVSAPDLFLGLTEGQPCFCSTVQPHANARAAFDTIGTLVLSEAPLFAAALSLAWWHSRHRFCANCGHKSAIERGGWSRSCSNCSAQHFPRVDPVVIMLAEHDGRLLLGCHARALDDELTIDLTELDDARWFTRAEVKSALAGDADAPFLPPPRFAIARTLLEHWLAA